MNFLQCIILLQLTAVLALGLPAQQSQQANLPNDPETLVRSFYQQVVARHPKGLLEGENKRIFEPYLSQALLHRIDLAQACSVDWDQHDPEPDLKAKMISDYGLFSGGGVEGEPRSFQIQRTQSEKDGFLRVYVRLKWEEPSKGQSNWRVADVMLRENGHYVIDDVIYINDSVYPKDEVKPANRRLSGYLSAGCNGPRWIKYSLPNDPEAFVRSFYQQVVARQPTGIPMGADMKIFAPYLSKTLLHKIDLAIACGRDWDRQDQRRMLMKDALIEKPPLAWLECGLFSGEDEKTSPGNFQIERTQAEQDGSFRVYVRLMWRPPDGPGFWRVAAVLVQEDGHLVVDDVIFLKDKYDNHDSRLSEILAMGCNGTRWVGYRDR
jgi:hypothetical protein